MALSNYLLIAYNILQESEYEREWEGTVVSSPSQFTEWWQEGIILSLCDSKLIPIRYLINDDKFCYKPVLHRWPLCFCRAHNYLHYSNNRQCYQQRLSVPAVKCDRNDKCRFSPPHHFLQNLLILSVITVAFPYIQTIHHLCDFQSLPCSHYKARTHKHHLLFVVVKMWPECKI